MQDIRDLEKTSRILALKVVQVIIQSRSGVRVKSDCKANSNGTDWFNLDIEDSPEVSTETKRSLHSKLIDSPVPLCVEISVRTFEGRSRVLELWTLGVLPKLADPCSSKLTNTVVYNRMGTLLKSLVSVSRMTPAYKISRGQGPDSYIICYRIFMAEPQIHVLGDDHKHIRVGQVRTQVGMIHLSVSYRTNVVFPPTRKGEDSLMLKSNHFQSDLDPRQNDVKYKYYNNVDKIGAFVSGKVPIVMNDFDDDIPFNCLLIGQLTPPLSESFTWENVKDEPDDNAAEAAKTNSRNGSQRNGGTTANAKDEFVMVDFKIPFSTAKTNSDLGSFFRACKHAPQLEAFEEEQTVEQQVGDLAKELEKFETNMRLYDDIVDSMCKSKNNN